MEGFISKEVKLIKPSFEILEQKPGAIGLLQHIERCGRTCYKSEDKITEDSAEKFVDMLVRRGHTAMVEHGTIYLRIPEKSVDGQYVYPAKGKYIAQKYSIANSRLEGVAQNPYSVFYVTTNYRVLLQNGWLDDLQYLCEPTEYHTKRITVKFICDRGVSHEFVRHRVFSFAQESTRYCNYSKDKFNKECTFIIPEWLDVEEGHHKYDCSFVDQKWTGPNNTEVSHQWLDTDGHVWYPNIDEHLFLKSLSDSEEIYFKLLEQGWIAQQARAVLPNSLKTELIMTGTIEQWEGFFKLRCAKDAHPQARELAVPLYEEFVKRGYITARISK